MVKMKKRKKMMMKMRDKMMISVMKTIQLKDLIRIVIESKERMQIKFTST